MRLAAWRYQGSVVAICLWLTALAVQAAEKLQQKMSPEEFRSAGLHRLSPTELDYLNQWLDPDPPTAIASFGEEQLRGAKQSPTSSDREILTRISGEFSGWNGRTIFKLVNGQVWQQRQTGQYVHKAHSPEVIIRRGNFGYYLKLVETHRQVPVKRLK